MTEQKAKFGQRAGRFFKEIRLEMKKVIWPTKKQLINNTLTVFAACLLIGLVIWLADAGLGIIFRAVFGQ
ncbi:MAG: preprotein translocase subunit SecE [Clostridiaceae bacterium]|nr:preprotein translocase subunit SecE [Clostridiaceae bacterium]